MTDILDPGDCACLADVRAGIDQLDRRLVRLLAERSRYVLAAARFKNSAAEVHAADRVAQVLAQVRSLAADEGVPPAAIERVYRTIIAAMTELEQQQWQRR